MKKTCTICGKKFYPGRNGLLNPVACDHCLQIERIADHACGNSAWLPGETEHEYEDIGIVTREQARKFGKATK